MDSNQAAASGGLERLVRRARAWWEIAREGDDPRWQGRVVRPVVGWAGRRGNLTFEELARRELAARRLLGQPLSRRAWDRMTFNDKIAYRRLRVRDPILQRISDKLSMRDLVTERLGADSLPALLKVAGHASELASLQGPYVLKANHGSQMVMFLGDGETLSSEQVTRTERWLAEDYAWDDLEWGYLGARRLLLAEEYLHLPGRLKPPVDYKLYAFDGEVRMIEILPGRLSVRRSILRHPDWTPVAGHARGYPRASESETPRPFNLELMLECASELSRGFGFIRVDLYDLGDRVKVGELTPYPDGGNSGFSPPSIDAWLGQAWRRAPYRAPRAVP